MDILKSYSEDTRVYYTLYVPVSNKPTSDQEITNFRDQTTGLKSFMHNHTDSFLYMVNATIHRHKFGKEVFNDGLFRWELVRKFCTYLLNKDVKSVPNIYVGNSALDKCTEKYAVAGLKEYDYYIYELPVDEYASIATFDSLDEVAYTSYEGYASFNKHIVGKATVTQNPETKKWTNVVEYYYPRNGDK